jgi:hypothetical protein
MRLLQPLVALSALVSPLATALSHDGISDFNTVSIYGWPLTGEPTPIAIIKIDPIIDPLNRTASLFSYSPHKITSAANEVVRVGILEPTTRKWSGSAVGREAFDPSFDRKFVLYLDRTTGRVWHVHVVATEIPQPIKVKGKKKKKDKAGAVKEVVRTKGETTVEVVVNTSGPQPALNKPVVLNEEGKIEGADGEDNRTFLQK